MSLLRFPDKRRCPRCGFQMPFFGVGLKTETRGRWRCPACDALLAHGPNYVMLLVPVLGLVMLLLHEAWPAVAVTVILTILLASAFARVVMPAEQPPLDGPRHDDDPESLRRRGVRAGLFRTTLMVIGVYVGICFLLFLFQSKLIYFPYRDIEGTPRDIRLEYDDVSFEAADGVKLHGWFVPAPDARATVIFCHGNAGNISHRLDTLRILHRLGLSTFIFDYRGYGRSEGTPTEEGTYLDAEAAWKHLVEVRGIDPHGIIIHGRSLGASVAAHLAFEHPPRGLILESGMTSVVDRAVEIYPFLPARTLCRYRYDTLAIIDKIRSPVLIVHSPDDEIVPIHHGRRLHQAGHFSEEDFLEITGDHNTGYLLSGQTYTDGLDRFIDKAMRTPPRGGN